MKYYHYIDTANNLEYVIRANSRDAADRLAYWALKKPALNGEISDFEADRIGCPIIWLNQF